MECNGFIISNLLTGFVNDEDAQILIALYRKYREVSGTILKEVGDIKIESVLFQIEENNLLRIVYKKRLVWINREAYPKYTIIFPSKEFLKKFL